jgi:hypothetical protein
VDTEDIAARKARADRLRGKVEELRSDSQAPSGAPEEAKPPASPESPREFVQRRMREIEKQSDKPD